MNHLIIRNFPIIIRNFPRILALALFFGFAFSSAMPLPAVAGELSLNGKFDNVTLLTRNTDALAMKRRLIVTAKERIDISYFIIEDDPSSAMVLLDLMGRADKGVKVRVIVDYFMSQLQVPALMTLDAHPNIEVRRFRPPTDELIKALQAENIIPDKFLLGLIFQSKKMLEESLSKSPLMKLITSHQSGSQNWDLGDIHQVMVNIYKDLQERHNGKSALVRHVNLFMMRTHHKLMGVEGKRFVRGGRNISDEYHANLGDELLKTRHYPFQDTDISGIEVDGSFQQKSFDRLWSSKEVAPLGYRYMSADGAAPVALPLTELVEKAKRASHLVWMNLSDEAFRSKAQLRGKLFENTVPMGPDDKAITRAYADLIAQAKSRIDIVTAYFYIDSNFNDAAISRIYKELVAASRRGVKVRVFTNSPESTDLKIVNRVAYPGYARLEQEGIEVYELAEGQGSLHTKAMAVDDDLLAVGSYNMDPRSHAYDTNNLIIVRDSGGSAQMVRAFRDRRVDGLRWEKPSQEKINSLIHGFLDVPKSVINIFRQMI